MKKLYFLFALSLLAGSFASAQTITSTIVNYQDMVAWEATHPVQPCNTCPKKEIDGGWKKLISNLPIPAGAKVTTQANTATTPVTPNNPNNPLAASVPPAQNWLGHVDPGQTIPPDTHGAVGLNHVITATNDFIKIHAKAGGAQISQVSISTFTAIGNTCDPYMAYDPAAQKWVFSAIECTSNGNRVILMTSNTSDPTGTWRKVTWVPSSTDGSVLLDHPYTGFDNRWIVVSGRKFPSGFTGPILFIFDKAAMYAGSAITFGTNAQAIEKTTADGDAPLPVTVYDAPFSASGNPQANTFYILQSWNGTSIRLSTVTGNLPSATWNTGSAVFPSAAGTPWQTGGGNIAKQLGETRGLATNDARISTGVMMNGKLWCSQHISLPSTGTVDRVAIQWWQLEGAATGFGNVLQRGRIGGGVANEFKWFSGIAVNKFEDVVIGYTSSTATSRVGAAYSTRQSSTAPNTTDDELIYKTGLDVYWKDFGSGRARWGDYSHSALDPVDNSIWTIQQYASTKSGTGDNASRYGVWWAQVLFPSSLSQRDASLAAIVSPLAGFKYCNFPITPTVNIKNVGTDTIKSLTIVWQLDGVTQNGAGTVWNTPPGLATLQSANVNLAPVIPTLAPGTTHTVKAWTTLPNGLTDMRLNNDTVTISFTVAPLLPLNASVNFETLPFPPANWVNYNPDGAQGWVRRTGTNGPLGVSTTAMYIDAANYGAQGQVDRFQTEKIDLTGVDSINISWHTAKTYWPGFLNDTMRIVYSDDCGVTWKPTTYKKGGASFNTIPAAGQSGDYFPTNASEWRFETLSFSTCNLTSNSILFGWEFTNGFGNNIFVDNINITKVNTVNPNAAVLNILQPSATLCTNTFTPQITIANYGTSALTSATINVSVDGGTPTTTAFTGNIARCSTQVVTLSPITSVPGNHTLTIYTTNPNGSADLAPANDTSRKAFAISPLVSTPVFEGFEGTAFAPAGWSVQNPNGSVTWARSTAAARSGTGAMWINNPANANSTDVDRFFSPVVSNNATIDSMFVSFDHSYIPGARFPGSTVFPLDTLEVMVTTDCGATFKTIWKKWGEDLQSITDPNFANIPSFTPTQAGEWWNTKIYLTPYVGTSNFQVYFVAKGNKQNNIWLDNINITSRTLPAKLKNQGYLVYPSPFGSSFRIHHWVRPTDLQAAQVYNAAGQLMWDKRFNGDANTEEFVNSSRWANGTYVLKMTYGSKVVTERIVKTN